MSGGGGGPNPSAAGGSRLGGVLVELTFWIPAEKLERVVAFLHELDAVGVKWDAKLDSHPGAEVLENLPERIRILAAGPPGLNWPPPTDA